MYQTAGDLKGSFRKSNSSRALGGIVSEYKVVYISEIQPRLRKITLSVMASKLGISMPSSTVMLRVLVFGKSG